MVTKRSATSALTLAFWLCSACAPTARLIATDLQGTPIAIRQEQRGSTTIVDLQDITSGNGELILKPADSTWPKHLAFRVMPGAVHALLVRTDTGMLFTPLADTDPKPRDVMLQPSLYSARTSQIQVRWQQ
jgi:hypothetical protein